MSLSHFARITYAQNSPDYTLNLEEQPTLFKRGLLKKELNPPQEDQSKPRTVTITCLVTGCR